MSILLREYDETGEQYQDTEFAATRIQVGAGADQTLQLLSPGVKPRHASLILEKNGHVQLLSQPGCQVLLNGSPTDKTVVGPGDVITIDGNTLTVMPPPSGFVLALSLRRNPEEMSLEGAYQTSLMETDLPLRSASWILLLLVLVVGLGLPLIWPSTGDSANTAADVLWSSGPLHGAHQNALGNNCSACHQKMFQPVQNAACEHCHDVAEHGLISGEQGSRDPHHLAANGQPCASCHREHNEPGSLLVEDNALCVKCHQNELGQVSPVTGFTAAAHGPFRLTLLSLGEARTGAGDWVWHREPPRADLAEQSNLIFNHQLHLDVDSVRTLADDRAMVCSDCHRLSADRQHFEPITMERDCRGCHALAFVEDDPARQLPHDQPAMVVDMLTDYFISRFADPQRALDQGSQRRRRPGQEALGEACTDSALECGRKRAYAEAEQQFGRSGCVTCHRVKDSGAPIVRERWSVDPVRLNGDWYPLGRFDHQSHLTQTGGNENQRCDRCHQASASSVAGDILIPGRDNCLQCHQDDGHGVNEDTQPVVLGCVECHAFHQAVLVPGHNRSFPDFKLSNMDAQP